MRYVYKLEHKRKVETNDVDRFSTKLIGFYSSRAKALSVIERYKSIEGFKDYPDDFIIEKCEVDFDDFIFE
ncbi:MAG: hypothetical protein GX660_22405 [Clostridiaceae bacterium]|nr:hypothetical protein [Clostridiaceae bacterium]